MVVGGAAVALRAVWPTGGAKDETLTATAQIGSLQVVVSERGELESSNTVVGACELNGSQNKIIFLVPEGTKVKKGEVVCRFDPSEIDKTLAKQEIDVKQAKAKLEASSQELAITKNTVESEMADAEVESELATLDVTKYTLGDFIVEESNLLGQIALAEVELEKAKELYEQMKQLVKKGFKTPEQLRASQQAVAQTKNYLERDQQKLQVLRDYEAKRKTTELKSKVRQAKAKVERSKANAIAKLAKAKSELDSAESTYSLTNQQYQDFIKQKEKCILTATQDGVVAYANKPWYDASQQIREGASCYSRQAVFTLPDMSKLQVKLNIHEAMIKKVRAGQTAEIRIDAFPQLAVNGTVKSVSVLADSNEGWISGGTKQYPILLSIDKMPPEDLKPGMTAQVKILVSEISQALLAPIPAVTEQKNQTYVYVKTGAKFERRQVKVGDHSESHVHILEGLKEGEVVALDARKRAAEDFKDEANKTPALKPQEQKPLAKNTGG